ncbi:MAG: 2,3-diphosphoglycerate-dependent phosphoglycerate mutase [Roseibacillus sp.]
MHQLTLLRHGFSQWNLENRFTGWTDVDLCEQGRKEAQRAGQLLRKEDSTFDRVYTSLLKRAVHTAWGVMDELDQAWLPVVKDWHLNERHYGKLQGLNKAETARKHGDEQVQLWRRGYHPRPPAITEDDARNPIKDPRYSSLSRTEIPFTESLQDVLKRTVAYWLESIAPQVQSGERILIVAHGNTFRALIKYFDGLSDTDVEDLEVPTGIPLVYKLNPDLSASSRKYLSHQEHLTTPHKLPN